MNRRNLLTFVFLNLLLLCCKKYPESVHPKINCRVIAYSSLSTPLSYIFTNKKYKTFYQVSYNNSQRAKVSITREGEQMPVGYFDYAYIDSTIIQKYTIFNMLESVSIYKLNDKGFVISATEIVRGDTTSISKYEYDINGFKTKSVEIRDNKELTKIFNYQNNGSIIVNYSDNSNALYEFYDNLPDTIGSYDNLPSILIPNQGKTSKNLIKSITYSSGYYVKEEYVYENDTNGYITVMTRNSTRRHDGNRDFLETRFEKYECH